MVTRDQVVKKGTRVRFTFLDQDPHIPEMRTHDGEIGTIITVPESDGNIVGVQFKGDAWYCHLDALTLVPMVKVTTTRKG